jgi:hypothetical protein
MQEPLASSTKVVQILMCPAHLASAVKVDVKKNFLQQLLLQQLLMIYQVNKKKIDYNNSL